MSQFKKSEAAPVVNRTQTASDAPKEVVKEEPAAEEKNNATASEGPKVVGKLDLEALKPKKTPAKAAEPAEALSEATEEAPKATDKPPSKNWFEPPTNFRPTVVGKISARGEEKGSSMTMASASGSG